jgi:hypothetical protein
MSKETEPDVILCYQCGKPAQVTVYSQIAYFELDPYTNTEGNEIPKDQDDGFIEHSCRKCLGI